MRHKRNRYVEYDYEEQYNKSIEDMGEHFVEQMINTGNKNIYATKEIEAGEQLELEMYPEFKKWQIEQEEIVLKMNEKRKEAQDRYNDKKSIKHINRIINENFTDKDMWMTLTFDNDNYPADMKDAAKKFNNFIAKLNYARKKQGFENSKYVYVIEYDEKAKIRYHIHAVMDGALPMDVVESKWTYGSRNQVRRLAKDEAGYTGLSTYITKQSVRVKRKFSCSKNLRKYKVKVNHYKFKQMDINDMVRDENVIKEKLEKRYPGYAYTHAEVKYNWFNNRFYIYARMRRVDNESKYVHSSQATRHVSRKGTSRCGPRGSS